MSKFKVPDSIETATPEIIRAFIKDRKNYQTGQARRGDVSSFHPDSIRNMAHSLGESASSLLALDSNDAEEPKVDTVEMTARFVITTAARDRHGDIVLPRGCVSHLKNYTRNPRVFFAHKTDDLPIASARDPYGNLALEILEDRIYSTAYFHGETRESELIFRLVARKELQASSIGFLPIRASLIAPEDDEDLMDLETGEDILDFRSSRSSNMPCLRFLEWDMIEWSIVPIPANQDALAAHLSRGHIEGEKISPSIRRALSLYVPQQSKKSVSFALPFITSEERKIETFEKELEKEIETFENEHKDSESDKEKLDDVYKTYKKETNMSYSTLKAWSENSCSKRASLSKGPIKRNLELLSTPKDKWTSKHITWANKTISFNSRMQGMPRGERLSEECPWSKRDISLKNWAYDPGKTPKSKKDLSGIEIQAMPLQGPTPGVDHPVLEKDYISVFENLGTKEFKADANQVRMAMAVLLSLQEGVDIPKKLKLGVYNRLAKAYKVLYLLPLEYRNISGLEEIEAMFPGLDFKEFAIVSIKEKNWFKSAIEDLVPPPTQGKPKKKKKEDDDDEEKKVDDDEESAKKSGSEDEDKDDDDVDAEDKATKDDDIEDNDDEDLNKKSADDEDDDEDSDEDEDSEEKSADEEEADPEVDTKDVLKSMSELMHSMHECSTAHTDLLTSLHEKMDNCMNALTPKEEEKPEEDEMKTILGALLTLKSNQDALNKRLFEVTGKR